MANVNIPLVQTDDKNINQLQQNIIQGIKKALGDFLFSVNTYGTTIGEVKSAMLTLSQFQSQMGTGWVLCDGSACQNSKYSKLTGNNNVPDMRSCVLRMKDNGRSLNPDGDLSLGTYQADNYFAHNHISNPHFHTIADPTHQHTVRDIDNNFTLGFNGGVDPGGSRGFAPSTAGRGTTWGTYSSATGITIDNATVTLLNSGGNETRMKNITINYFIRIN